MSCDPVISAVLQIYTAPPQDRLKQAIIPRLAANNLVRIQWMADRKAVRGAGDCLL
jgi:hypothetical protein